MNISGQQNFLALPQMTQVSFEVTNLIVGSYDDLAFDFFMQEGEDAYENGYARDIRVATFLNGDIYAYISGQQYLCGTYQTGVPCGFSGWLDLERSQCFVDFDGIKYQNNDPQYGGFNLRAFVTYRSSATPFSADIKLMGQPITYGLTLDPIEVGLIGGGQITSSTSEMMYGYSKYFFNSNESLFTIDEQITGQALTRTYDFTTRDGDSSHGAGPIKGVFALETLAGTQYLDIDTSRYMPSGGTWSLTGDFTGVNFGSQFDGFWSGRTFVYQDNPSFLTRTYTVGKTDSLGVPFDKTLVWSLSSQNNPSGIYVSGFTLTASGEYVNPPIAQFTGYYSVSGLQQDIASFLFSSGCTGNLLVTYSGLGGYGTGASGYLMTSPVSFQDIYTSGINTFYQVTGYQVLREGSGFSEAPKANFLTGSYGATCYDVPRVYGYNVAWFRPATSSGALRPVAAYLTGVPLYTTGLVSGGALTGYKVTGLEITNIGSGYTNAFLPRFAFLRTGSDTLTGNASGTLGLLNSGVNVTGRMTIDVRSGMNPWETRTALSGVETLVATENSFSIRLTVSGASNTYPWTGYINLKESVSDPVYVSDLLTFAHTFDTSLDALKKNDNVNTGVPFSTGMNLSFLLSETELDTLYSSLGFLNNSQGFDLGDLDF